MKELLTSLLIAILIFIVIFVVIIGIGVALSYILTVIPCDILVYAETYFLLGLFMLLVYAISDKKITFSKKQ